MEPDSVLLVVLLVLLAGGLIYAAIRLRPIAVKIAAGAVSIVLAAVSGVVIVNIYYGYYQTWGQLAADLSGNYSGFTDQGVGRRDTGTAGHGRMESMTLPGPASGINRSGYVYLPPQYFQAKYAHASFPVLELLHGSPGNPGNWVIQINLAGIMDKLIAEHLVGPMIVVMPAIDAGHQFQECVDAPAARDDTYVSQDVPHDIRARLRASTVPAEWGIAGYSSGGYCAANLAMRHPGGYGAAAIIDGYFRPNDGPAAGALHFNAQAEAQNDPLLIARHLAVGANPLPALWIASPTGGSKYTRGAQAFVAALHGVEAVTLVSQPGAGHNYYAWRSVIPRMVSWIWNEIAPPDLRVQFPIAGTVSNRIVVPPLQPSSAPSGAPSTPTVRKGSGHATRP